MRPVQPHIVPGTPVRMASLPGPRGTLQSDLHCQEPQFRRQIGAKRQRWNQVQRRISGHVRRRKMLGESELMLENVWKIVRKFRKFFFNLNVSYTIVGMGVLESTTDLKRCPFWVLI